MKNLWIVLSVLILLILTAGCDLSTPEPAPDSNAIATSVAETLAANQPPTQPPSEPTTEPTAEPTVEPADIFAPDPLTPGYTGLIFDFETCYDFDTYLPIDSGNPECDFILDEFGTLSPQHGALINGSDVSFNPPSKNACIASDLLPDLLAPLSDLYLCFQTSRGSYGFFVERDLQLDQNRIIFDMYLFP